MNELIEQLNEKYENITKVPEVDLYRVETLYNNTINKIMYFDFSQNIPESDEDIEKYHHEYIAPIYYEIPGSLQWNFYLYFIYDGDEDYQRFSELEHNKDYVRKIVLRKEAFPDFLNNDINDFYDQEVNEFPNLLDTWDEHLEGHRLKFIADESIPKKDFIEKLFSTDIEERVIEPVESVIEKLDTQFPNNTFIQNISLNDYRDFPLEREFEFGKVNLIHGVNGSGKTSLLEAIEIITCGKTNRNSTEEEPNISNLRLGFLETDVEVSNNPRIYINRDKMWYGSTERRNMLYENFKKFNFYHADAAIDISRDKDIEEVIKNIVLGKDIAKYEKKILGAIELFEVEKRRITNTHIPKLDSDISSTKEKLDSIRNLKIGLDSTLFKLKETLGVINWKKSFTSDYEKEEDVFLEIADLKKIIDEIYKLSTSVNIVDISTVDKLLIDVIGINNSLAEVIKEISAKSKKKEQFNKKIKNISSRIATLEKLSEWINIENISKVLGLDEKLSANKKELILLENVLGDVAITNSLEKYLKSEFKILEYKEKISHLCTSLTEKKDDLIDSLKEKEKESGLLNTYKINLQDFTRKTMLLTNEDKLCPVCKSTFEASELKTLVDNISGQIDDIKVISKIKEDIESIKQELESRLVENDELNKIILTGSKLLDEDKITDKSIKDIVENILEANTKMFKLKEEIFDLEKLKDYFISKGIIEHEYSSYIKTYTDKYYEEYGDLSINSLTEIKKKYLDELNSQSMIIKTFDDDILTYSNKINEIEKIRDTYFENNHELSMYYSRLIQDLQQLKKYKELMFTYINPNTTMIEFLHDNINSLNTISLKYSDLLIQNGKDSIIEQSLQGDLESKELELVNLNQNVIKLNDSLSVLNSLESSDNSLNQFFIRNEESILETFMNIHAPKEFNGFEFSDGKIQLRRIGVDDPVSVERISTGQKSALALSIFLTMNRNAENAPKYILLDDPVSNTDDINILAFFDFLRDISLSNQRQLFFVTANSKIANLFRKKFDFLGNDFKNIPLSR